MKKSLLCCLICCISYWSVGQSEFNEIIRNGDFSSLVDTFQVFYKKSPILAGAFFNELSKEKKFADEKLLWDVFFKHTGNGNFRQEIEMERIAKLMGFDNYQQFENWYGEKIVLDKIGDLLSEKLWSFKDNRAEIKKFLPAIVADEAQLLYLTHQHIRNYNEEMREEQIKPIDFLETHLTETLSQTKLVTEQAFAYKKTAKAFLLIGGDKTDYNKVGYWLTKASKGKLDPELYKLNAELLRASGSEERAAHYEEASKYDYKEIASSGDLSQVIVAYEALSKIEGRLCTKFFNTLWSNEKFTNEKAFWDLLFAGDPMTISSLEIDVDEVVKLIETKYTTQFREWYGEKGALDTLYNLISREVWSAEMDGGTGKEYIATLTDNGMHQLYFQYRFFDAYSLQFSGRGEDPVALGADYLDAIKENTATKDILAEAYQNAAHTLYLIGINNRIYEKALVWALDANKLKSNKGLFRLLSVIYKELGNEKMTKKYSKKAK